MKEPMKDTERRQLLKDEYILIQNVIQGFDARAITIKGWSITFSMVVLIGAFASHVPIAFLIASFSALLFWLIEGTWKIFQHAYYGHSLEIERYFSGEIEDMVPLQAGHAWFNSLRTMRKIEFVSILFYGNVLLPHVVIIAGGVILYFMYLNNLIVV
jgi:hypothetical protein